MGKSPGKWIKTLLFGKKSARSHGTKGGDSSRSKNEKGQVDEKIPPPSVVDSRDISVPVLLSSDHNGDMQPTDVGTHSNVIGNASVISPKKDGHQGVTGSLSSDANSMSEEQAATKAQAAFRGYLARRAFHALKGIIRLQALGRGYLVRRQAVATLHAMDGILKLQTFIRGKRVGHSKANIEVVSDFGQTKLMESKSFDAFKTKLLTNLFISKLLSSSILATALQIQYAEGEPNSVFSWLERWNATGLWTSLHQPKKTSDSKVQIRKSNYAMETESGKSKRNTRRNSATNNDSTQTNATIDSEKAKRGMRKSSSSAVDAEQEHPQSELEKVKRNLRKISKMMEASEEAEVEIDKNDQSFRKVVDTLSDIPDQGFEEPEEQVPNNIVLFPELDIDNGTASKFLEEEESINLLSEEQPSKELQPLQQIENEQNTSKLNKDQNPKDEQVLHDVNKNKRRSSFSAKSEYTENGSPNTPVLPSYMAATESAKAKLRAQNSPRLVSDSDEKNGFARRHSLPSTNVKLSSHSPRTQRVTQTSGRSGIRSDKSLFSSRDGNERAVQVEWRR